MIIANHLKNTNIAEYILYIWQTEDLIRAYNFDIGLIRENIILKYKYSKEVLKEIEHYFEGLIDLMEVDKIKHRGHFQFLVNIINDLGELHNKLLNHISDKNYQELYNIASNNIKQLKEKSKNKDISDIEVCFNGLYGLLIMRLKKQEVSKETIDAMKTISNLLGYLSSKYLEKNNLN